tara:strand:+ start:34 stop:1209 length:1176 start_codon:yes stop_codon:yes gene_type:complete
MKFFELNFKDGDARAGTLYTSHGAIDTPVFMPVATQGSVKAIGVDDLNRIGSQIVLANTYHLYLRPGHEVIEKISGLHKFMGWNKAILTDSGGFQGFSLAHLRTVTKDGFIFKSHIDGSIFRFNYEDVVKFQTLLGSDIIMPLDICSSSNQNKSQVEESMILTNEWISKARKLNINSDQFMFGIVQGGMYEDLRKSCVEQMIDLSFPGYAIGGLSVGEDIDVMYRIVDYTANILPLNSPRYLMGVGSPENLIECISKGIDMFDCVLPTRIARNGSLFLDSGRINITNATFKFDDNPIDLSCNCFTCAHYSKAYIHHLFKAKEFLAYRLASIHNLYFIVNLLREIRKTILMGEFNNFKKEFLSRYNSADRLTQVTQKKMWIESQERKGRDKF